MTFCSNRGEADVDKRLPKIKLVYGNVIDDDNPVLLLSFSVPPRNRLSVGPVNGLWILVLLPVTFGYYEGFPLVCEGYWRIWQYVIADRKWIYVRFSTEDQVLSK